MRKRFVFIKESFRIIFRLHYIANFSITSALILIRCTLGTEMYVELDKLQVVSASLFNKQSHVSIFGTHYWGIIIYKILYKHNQKKRKCFNDFAIVLVMIYKEEIFYVVQYRFYSYRNVLNSIVQVAINHNHVRTEINLDNINWGKSQLIWNINFRLQNFTICNNLILCKETKF